MLKYVFKNLSRFFKQEKMVFCLLITCIFVSSLMIHFSLGIYSDYKNRKLSGIQALKDIEIQFENSNKSQAHIQKKEVENFAMQMSPELSNAISNIFLIADIDENLSLECRFTVRDGEYAPCFVFRDNILKYNMADTYFTEEQEQERKQVALCGVDFSIQAEENIKEQVLYIQDKKYQIIGYQSWNPEGILVPFSSLEMDTYISEKNGIHLYFPKAITRRQYDELCSIVKESFENRASVPELNIENEENLSFYNSVLLIGILIDILAALNITILFKYILLQRERVMAIYRICGMTKWKAFCIYIFECMSIIISVFWVSTVFYHFIIVPKLSFIFEHIGKVYSLNMYLIEFMIYILITMTIISVMIAANIWNKPIAEMK